MTAAQAPGPGVDLQGRAVIDPTQNVKEKLEDTVRRLDDLSSSREDHRKEMESLRRHYEGLLREAEQGRRLAEKDRLDAIRIIDVTAVAARATEANDRASQLAAQLQATAEANRVQVAAVATAVRAELIATVEPLQKRLEEVSRVQYEQQGARVQVVDSRENQADLKPIIDAIAELTRAQAATATGQAEARGGQAQIIDKRASNGLLIAAGGFALTMFVAVIGLITFLVSQPDTTPTVIEVPVVTVPP